MRTAGNIPTTHIAHAHTVHMRILHGFLLPQIYIIEYPRHFFNYIRPYLHSKTMVWFEGFWAKNLVLKTHLGQLQALCWTV